MPILQLQIRLFVFAVIFFFFFFFFFNFSTFLFYFHQLLRKFFQKLLPQTSYFFCFLDYFNTIKTKLTKKGISPAALSSSIAACSVSPRRLKFLSLGNFTIRTAPSSPDLCTDELPYKKYDYYLQRKSYDEN